MSIGKEWRIYIHPVAEGWVVRMADRQKTYYLAKNFKL